MFLERLKELIQKNGITQKQFLEEVGLSKNTMRNWELNKNIPSPLVLKSIADYFGVSVDYLLGKSSERDSEPTLPPSENVIKIVGRDGSYIEKRLTDEQKKMLQAMIQSLPEAPDDL